MISNEWQWRRAKGLIAQSEADLAALPEADLGPAASSLKALRASLEARIGSLRSDMAAYEALRAGEGKPEGDLGRALIRARILRGMTQQELADAMRSPANSIARWEAIAWRSASLRNLERAARALKAALALELED